MSQTTIAQYREAAKKLYENEGTIEFDDKPAVSRSEDGAYVQCWVWVAQLEPIDETE